MKLTSKTPKDATGAPIDPMALYTPVQPFSLPLGTFNYEATLLGGSEPYAAPNTRSA